MVSGWGRRTGRGWKEEERSSGEEGRVRGG